MHSLAASEATYIYNTGREVVHTDAWFFVFKHLHFDEFEALLLRENAKHRTPFGNTFVIKATPSGELKQPDKKSGSRGLYGAVKRKLETKEKQVARMQAAASSEYTLASFKLPRDWCCSPHGLLCGK